MVNGALAVIAARGGSKRIPRKNIIDFFGKPLLAWTVEAALSCGVFRRVIVSTDDREIAGIARACGADVPFMRERFADDSSPVSEVVADAVSRMRDDAGEEYETVAHLMANCPLRGSDEIAAAYANFIARGHDSQISCFAYGWMNPWWACRLDGNQVPSAVFPDGLKARSQDLERLYCPTGAIWLARTDYLLKTRTFYGPGHRFFPLRWQAAVDIDDHDDLAMARAVYLLERPAGAGTT